MATIDTEMYVDLKNWFDGDEPQNRSVKFVCSKNKMLTNNTIRKVMFDIDKEDEDDENYVALYSARNLFQNMRTYFSDIAKMYFCTPNDDTTLQEILDMIPPSCYWITLIIKDLEELSGQHNELQQFIQNLATFAEKGARLILIAESNDEKIFSECKCACAAIKAAFGTDEANKFLLPGTFEQDENPKEKEISFESASDERAELNFYWNLLYEQSGQNYFDYEFFKELFKETWVYFIPRVAAKQIFRQDISLIEKIGYFSKCYSRYNEGNRIDGCSPWELDAAAQFMIGLNDSLIDWKCEDIDFADRTLSFKARIDIGSREPETLYVSASVFIPVKVTPENFPDKIDALAEMLHRH